MKRVAMILGAVAVGIVAVAMASSSDGVALGAGLDSRPVREGSYRELRRATRWKCTVRHAKSQNDYTCTKRDQKKSCLCAIQQCKHWNPGHERHCSRACHCGKV